MKKQIAILLAAVLTVCILAGCQPAGTVQFTLEKAFEINDAVWTHVDNKEIVEDFCKSPWNVKGVSVGRAHLGSANGYIFFKLHGGHGAIGVYPSVIPEVEIGGVLFEWCCENCLYAYKDGNLYRLIDLYESGEISAEDVENIKKQKDANTEERDRMLLSEEWMEEYSRWENEMEENGWTYAHGWEPPEGD